MQMPEIASRLPDAGLTAPEMEIANKIIGRGGRLRSSKPSDGVAA